LKKKIAILGSTGSIGTQTLEVINNNQKSHHQWLIEFEKEPKNLYDFEKELDLNLQKLNPYYKDLIQDKVLTTLKIKTLKKKKKVQISKYLSFYIRLMKTENCQIIFFLTEKLEIQCSIIYNKKGKLKIRNFVAGYPFKNKQKQSIVNLKYN
jgi:FlaA1/EpsC-like NDP-sugar epimerase